MEKFIFLFSIYEFLAMCDSKDNRVLSASCIDIIGFNNFVLIKKGFFLVFVSHSKYPDIVKNMLQVKN